jgi:hypothetical protein
MRLTKFAQTLCILGLVLAHAGVMPVRPSYGADDPSASTAQESERSQDELIDEVLGAQPAPQAKQPNVTVYDWLAAKRRARNAAAQTMAAQPQAATLNGTIIGVNLRTSTVDVEFVGGREPTIGSQFSVHRHRVFGTEHIGRLQVVYSAGDGRAIAKPVGGTDVNRLLEGDRVSGRIVSGAGETADRQATTVARSNKTRLAVTETSGFDGLSGDTAYSPDAETTRTGRKVPKLVAKLARAAKDFAAKPSGSTPSDDDRPLFGLSSADSETEPQDSTDLATQTPPAALPTDETETDGAPRPLPNRSGLAAQTTARPKWVALKAKSWKTLLKPGQSPDTDALERQTAQSAAPVKSSTSKSAKQTAVVPASAELPPSILLFEQEEESTEP